jgi:hypothetical protein
MQALPSRDDNQFRKFMSVRIKGTLRLPPLDGNGEPVGMEPISDFKNPLHGRNRAGLWPGSGGFSSRAEVKSPPHHFQQNPNDQ